MRRGAFVTPDPDQLLLTGLPAPVEPPPKPPRKPSPAAERRGRWLADVDGVRTVEEMAKLWFPDTVHWNGMRTALSQAVSRLRELRAHRMIEALPRVTDRWNLAKVVPRRVG